MSDTVISAATSSLPDRSMDRALGLAADLGFEAVELTLWGEAFHSAGRVPGLWWRETGEADRRALRESLAPFEHIDGHLPFLDCPLVSANKFVEALGRELVAEALGALGGLDGGVAVLRLAPCPARSYAELWDRLLEACRWLGDQVREAGLRLALSSAYPVGEEFVRFLDEVDHPAIGACLDVGHLASVVGRGQRNTDRGAAAYNAALLALADQLGPRIWHCHLHDVRYDDWRPGREIGTGILDLAALLARLAHHGCRGRLVLALEEADGPGALQRTKAAVEQALAAAQG